MTFALLLPPILSLFLLAAHCMRIGLPQLMVFPLAVMVLLIWGRGWVARSAQVLLVLGALEWIRIALVYIGMRRDLGMPWGRLALILGTVALFTLASSWIFETRRLRQRYQLD